MSIKSVAIKFAYFAAVSVSICLLFFVLSAVWIGYEAKRLCQEAEWEYAVSGCSIALSMQLEDEQQGFRTRNHAIWALGQFGDSQSLPTLLKYYTGNIPDREPLDEMISQYELKKAIELAGGGTNIAAWAWR